MFTQLLFFAVLCISTRAFTLQQEASLQRRCVDLQCPRSAFETGTQRLLVDEAGAQEDCKTCQDCTATGYSVCMQMLGPQNHRAKRQTTACSCAHAVPDSCLVKPAHGRVLNGSFVTHNVCYLNSLQTPPKPLATNEKFAVLVDVEVFWQEPYWLDFHVSNLKLHYEFKAGVSMQKQEPICKERFDRSIVKEMCALWTDLSRSTSATESSIWTGRPAPATATSRRRRSSSRSPSTTTSGPRFSSTATCSTTPARPSSGSEATPPAAVQLPRDESLRRRDHGTPFR
ncbi:hypothetical protein L596_005540 [Steinernema carpocapsae]|uniref:Uncharacterized protein n=1 Tax=Steinernema carpocapsae TaxID=34508 RepID=A0A4U8V4A3_STECR|nr:hypothetical protein L596_005540 [Steinernema carpocapsae]